MAGIAGLMTVTVGVAATSLGPRDRAGAKVAELRDLLGQSPPYPSADSPMFSFRKGWPSRPCWRNAKSAGGWQPAYWRQG